MDEQICGGEAAQGDVDHGLGDVELLFVVTNQAAPSCHPSEGRLDDPASREHFETGFGVAPADDFENKVAVDSGIHQLRAVRGAIANRCLSRLAQSNC